MKTKTHIANVTANAANFLVNWQPFNHRPFTSIYDWASRVRESDPAWIAFMEGQDDKIIVLDEPIAEHDTAMGDRREMIDETKPGFIRRNVSKVASLAGYVGKGAKKVWPTRASRAERNRKKLIRRMEKLSKKATAAGASPAAA